MDASSAGSFTIVCRLAHVLAAQPNNEAGETRRRTILSSFLSKFSNKEADLVILARLLFCQIDKAELSLGVGSVSHDETDDAFDMTTTTTPTTTITSVELALALARGCGAFDEASSSPPPSASSLSNDTTTVRGLLSTLPFAHHPTFTLRRAFELAGASALLGSPLMIAGNPAVMRSVVAECSLTDAMALLHMLAGEKQQLVGSTTPEDVATALGPDAAACFSPATTTTSASASTSQPEVASTTANRSVGAPTIPPLTLAPPPPLPSAAHNDRVGLQSLTRAITVVAEGDSPRGLADRHSSVLGDPQDPLHGTGADSDQEDESNDDEAAEKKNKKETIAPASLVAAAALPVPVPLPVPLPVPVSAPMAVAPPPPIPKRGPEEMTGDRLDRGGEHDKTAGGGAAKRARHETTAAAPAATTTALPTRACRYGALCLRRNPAHFREFSHPWGTATPRPAGWTPASASVDSAVAATAAAATTASGDVPLPAPVPLVAPAPAAPAVAAPAPAPAPAPPTATAAASSRAINGVMPKKMLPAYENITHTSASGGEYKIKFVDDGTNTYCCSCPPWRYQLRPPSERTCKHLIELLGESYETARCPDNMAARVGGARAKPAVAVAVAPAAATTTTAAAARRGAGGGTIEKVAIGGVLLAQKADFPKNRYLGWHCSEKLDGVRAYWTGKFLVSRNGVKFSPPAWFTKCLPSDQTLDGELFVDRGAFQKTVSIVKSHGGHAGWATVTYQVFDMPSKSEPFEGRLAALKAMFPSTATAAGAPAGSVASEIMIRLPPASQLGQVAAEAGGTAHVQVVPHVVVKDGNHVQTALDAVLAAKGEGLMVRQPGSKYVTSRSTTLLKIKVMDDCEAIVRGHEAGQGKYASCCGALVCELPNGKQFQCGSGMTDADRRNPPKIGAVITVRYQNLTDGGVPRFPIFVGVRIDATWPPVK